VTKKLTVALKQRTISHFLLLLFPRLEIKLRDRHFDTIVVMEAESQEVLNAHTDHGFQDASKKWQKRWE
jgi:nitrate reductase NapAB chaperone NapD